MASDLWRWLHYVQNLPYFNRRVEIARRVRPKLSRFLYKYKSIDEGDPVSTDHLRDLLVRSRLWLSSPVDFNDPFDMSAKIVANATAAERFERVEGLLKNRGLSYKERERMRRNFMRKPIDVVEKELGKIYENNAVRVGVFSFGGDPKSILMWSHYARNHTGICIQFERAADFRTLSEALPVEYSTEYPEVNWVKDFEGGLSRVMLRKHEGWSYEREYRIVRLDGAHSYLRFDPQAVFGITMGCRSTAEGRELVESLLEERHRAKMPSVRLFVAQKHGSKYQLVVLRK